jgi:hypothetical protein
MRELHPGEKVRRPNGRKENCACYQDNGSHEGVTLRRDVDV